MIRAAGILILNTEGQALFLKRGPGGDCPGMWCAPGGRIEDGESPEEAACRETLEESGFRVLPKQLLYLTRQIANRETTGAPPLGTTGLDIVVNDQPSMPVVGEQIDFITFQVKGIETFIPTLCDEHVAYAWAPLDNPPEPLHPGMRVALARGTMDELHVAEAIRDGQLTSPQGCDNFTLFDIRITGTDLSYRAKHKEYVWRDKAHYLNPRFLQRCNGLPVIWEHPEKNTLNSAEFSKRSIGTVVLPYIRDDEVWGIAKIYDGPAVKLMSENQLSTSPAVVWREAEANTKVVLEDGEALLIEGMPHLLDHIAVVERGVWDKGGDPTGVKITLEDSNMVKRLDGETEEQFKIRSDAEDNKLTQVLAGLGGLTEMVKGVVARQDAFEEEKKSDRKDAAKGRADAFNFSKRNDGEDDESFKKRGDAEEEEYKKDMMESGEPEESAVDKAKKKRKDSAEANESIKKADEEEEKKKADAEEEKKKADAEKDEKEKADATMEGKLEKMRAELRAEFEAKLPKPLTDKDYVEFASIQARYDDVYSMFGQSAGRPQSGETTLAYRRRLAAGLQMHDPHFKNAELAVHAVDEAGFAGIERSILTSAAKTAMSPATVAAGELRAIVRQDGGHTITTFVGEPKTWMDEFKPNGLAVKEFNRFNTQRSN